MHGSASGDGLARIAQAGTAVWLDGVSRASLRSGRLAELVRSADVAGVLISPESFATAVLDTNAYERDLAELAAAGAGGDEVALNVLADDARAACDVLRGVFDATGGRQGWVSVPVDPRLAHDTETTLLAARALRSLVERPNLLVGIPATKQGVPALRSAVAEGIGVVATCVVAHDRFLAVQAAFGEGLERAQLARLDLSRIASFAALPLAPLDAAADARLDVIGSDAAVALRGRLAIANAVLAYQAFESRLASQRWRELAAQGAHPQRPLWTSTTVVDPTYHPMRYIDELLSPAAAVALDERVLEEVAEGASARGDAVHAAFGSAQAVLDTAERIGLDYTEVTSAVEADLLARDLAAWRRLVQVASAAQPA